MQHSVRELFWLKEPHAGPTRSWWRDASLQIRRRRTDFFSLTLQRMWSYCEKLALDRVYKALLGFDIMLSAGDGVYGFVNKFDRVGFHKTSL